MTKQTIPVLETGMRVKCRNGRMFIVVKEMHRMYEAGGFMELASYSVNGEYCSYGASDPAWDIVSVYEGSIYSGFLDIENSGKLIWNSHVEEVFAKQQRRYALHNQLAQIQAELDSLED